MRAIANHVMICCIGMACLSCGKVESPKPHDMKYVNALVGIMRLVEESQSELARSKGVSDGARTVAQAVYSEVFRSEKEVIALAEALIARERSSLSSEEAEYIRVWIEEMFLAACYRSHSRVVALLFQSLRAEDSGVPFEYLLAKYYGPSGQWQGIGVLCDIASDDRAIGNRLATVRLRRAMRSLVSSADDSKFALDVRKWIKENGNHAEVNEDYIDDRNYGLPTDQWPALFVVK